MAFFPEVDFAVCYEVVASVEEVISEIIVSIKKQ